MITYVKIKMKMKILPITIYDDKTKMLLMANDPK